MLGRTPCRLQWPLTTVNEAVTVTSADATTGSERLSREGLQSGAGRHCSLSLCQTSVA